MQTQLLAATATSFATLCVICASTSAFAQVAVLPAPATTAAAVGDATPTGADTALLEPLLATLAAPGETRAKIAQRLTESSDPRAIVALRYAALHDRQPEVVDAAVLLLGRFRHAHAITALVDIAVGSDSVRPHRGAIDALSAHPLPSGPLALLAVAKNAEVELSVRRDALDALRRDHPDLVAKAGAPVLGGSTLVATVGGGYFGGFAMASVGSFAGNTNADRIGWVAGTIIGAGTGFIFGRQISDDRQHYYLSAMGWGAWAGTWLAHAVVEEPPNVEFIEERPTGLNRAVAGLSLLGELGGLGLAAYGADALHLRSSDVLVADIAGIAAAVATAGALGLVTPKDDKRPGYALLLTGGLLGLGVGVTAAPHMNFTPGGGVLTAYSGAEGMYYGGFLADLLLPDRDSSAGVALGGGLGVLAGGAIAQYTDLRVGNVSEMLLFSSYGKALGAGLSLLGGADERTVNGVHLAFGAVGMATAAMLADRTSYSGGDAAVVPIGTVLGLWHGAWIASLAHGLDQNRSGNFAAGMTLTTGALFGLGSVALAQTTGLTNMQATMGGTGAVWGAWFSGWTTVLLREASDTSVRDSSLILAGTDIGLATTIALLSPLVDLDPRVLAGASFGGMAGAGLSLLFATMFSEDSNLVIKANLTGSAVGLLAGGLIARAALADLPASERTSTGSAWPSWLSLPVKSVAAVPHFDAAGRPDGMVVQAALDFGK